MRFVALLFALVVGAFAAMFIVQTGQFSQPAHGPAAGAQAAPDAGPAAAPSDAGATASSQKPAAAPAGAQGTDVVASLTNSTRAVAASAAKSPSTLAARLTLKPKPDETAGVAQKTPPAAAAPTVRIHPPIGFEGIAFGMSVQQISARYPPAWRRETKDELTLVYNADQKGDQARFHFSTRGLTQFELQLKPPQGEALNPFYQQVKAQYAAVYGSLPGSADGGWNDGQTVLRIDYGATAVSVCFFPKT